MTLLRLTLQGAPRLAPWGLLFFVLLAGCGQIAPSEVRLAELQERELWRAGAEVYAPMEYSGYLGLLRSGKDQLIAAERRFAWFRDYGPATRELRAALARGDVLHALIEERRLRGQERVAISIAEQRGKIERLRGLTTLVTVGRTSRELLAQADVLVSEAEALAARTLFPDAEERLERAAGVIGLARDAATPALQRFVDREQVASWRKQVDETIRASRARGTSAIVVSKVDRSLVLYKKGRAVKTYDISLGSESVRDKVYAGDRATPEGRYRIVRKNPNSKFSKALLINYPNAEDERRFALAKKNGEVPRRIGIGSLIEIHGGGREGMTLGCVALDDRHMDELYALVSVGTPVTIVGATEFENVVSLALKDL